MKRVIQIVAVAAIIGAIVAMLQKNRQLPPADEGIWKPVGPTPDTAR
ncbi:MAG: hypothetical protein AB1Z57_04190 [Acidimicrobiia bacterium]|jgi:hypothetical protein